MDATMMNNMCRCCASDGAFKDLKTTYHWMGEDEIYGTMLKDCFDLTLSITDNDEAGICEVCITQLRNALNFKKQVLHTEEQFKKKLQTKFFKPNIVKVELPTEDKLDSEDNNMSGDDGFSGSEYEVIIKTETAEEPKSKKRAASKASTSRAKKKKTSDSDDVPPKHGNEKQIGYKDQKATVKDEDDEHVITPQSEIDLYRWSITQILMCSNATPIRRYVGIGYTCCYCDEQYPQAACLKQHTLTLHTDLSRANFMTNMSLYEFAVKLDVTALCCTICNGNMDSFNQLVDHLIEVHKKTIYTNSKTRILPMKFNKDILQCDVCLSEFHNLKYLLTHMNIHYQNFVCDICDSSFITHSALNIHAVIHKVGEHQCNYCPKVFSTNSKRLYHHRTVHTDTTRRYKCGYCLEYFKDYHSRITHLVDSHGVQPKIFECYACDKTFSSRKRLTIHTNRDHLLLRPHQCPECDKSFYTSTMLKDHMVKHTGVRNFQCSVCQKSYTMKKTLREHMRIHQNDRRFKCERCGQAFVQKCSWRGHMRNKHGEDV